MGHVIFQNPSARRATRRSCSSRDLDQPAQRLQSVTLSKMVSPDTFARYAAMRVPRYTSYPTAPHFSAAVDETQYRSWLRSLPADEPGSVYLHIPFCREMCWYCGCHTTVTRRKTPVARYAATLAREIELVTSELGEGLE